MLIPVHGIDKAELLVALFSAIKPYGIAAHSYSGHETLTIDEAREILRSHTAANPYLGLPYHIDYLKGRALKIDLAGDEIDTSQYDRYNGAGTAVAVVEKLRRQLNTYTQGDGTTVERREDGSQLISIPGHAPFIYHLSEDGLTEYE